MTLTPEQKKDRAPEVRQAIATMKTIKPMNNSDAIKSAIAKSTMFDVLTEAMPIALVVMPDGSVKMVELDTAFGLIMDKDGNTIWESNP